MRSSNLVGKAALMAFALAGGAGVLTGARSARAAVVPFTETFAASASNWSAPAGAATFNAAGGPDGSGFISAATNVNSANTGLVLALRGQSNQNASGGAFVGNWLTEGVAAFSFDVRHDAALPMSFGARFAGVANFPAAIGLQFAPVQPSTWTRVTIPITPAFAGFITFEGSDFSTVFSNIGNVQVVYSVPGALAGTGAIVNVSADNISIIPAPGAAAVGACVVMAAARRRSRRSFGY